MNKKHQNKNIIVLYHQDCLDGFCGRWIAWKKFGDHARYYATPPHQFPDHLKNLKNATIYVIDSSLSKDDVQRLRKHNCKIVVIDHHISSESDVKFADEYRFDVKHSGSMLAWKYFFPKVKVPWLVRYVEDGDLWNFKIAYTNEVRNILVLRGFDIKKWDITSRELELKKNRNDIIRQGKLISQYRNRLIEESVQDAYLVRFGGHVVYAVNVTTEAIRSEVAHRLYVILPPFSIVWAQEKDQYHISLRSDGKFDVSKLAKKYGGGGHKVAAGFLLPATKSLPWKSVKKRV